MTDTNRPEAVHDVLRDMRQWKGDYSVFADRIERTLSARASAGEGGPVLWVSRDALQQATACANADRPTVATVNAWNDPQRLAGHDPVALYTAAPQPAQAGASGGGDAAIPKREIADFFLDKLVQIGTFAFASRQLRRDFRAVADCMKPVYATPASPATGCTDWRNEAFNLADTVIEHIRCGQEQKARDAIMEAFTTSQTAATQGGEWVMVPERCLDGSMTIEEMVSAFIELHPGAKDYRHVFKLCATAAIKSAAPQPQEAVLDKPACVGATVFSAGVPCRLVIDRAQREQEWHENPPLPNADMAGLRKLLTTPPAHGDGEGDYAAKWFAECRRVLEDVSTEMRATGRGDTRFRRLIESMPRRVTPLASGALTTGEREVIETLLGLAYAAWGLADNTEDSGDEGLTVERSDFAALEHHLDELAKLPDDQPGYTMGEAAKARWALRRVLDAALALPAQGGKQ